MHDNLRLISIAASILWASIFLSGCVRSIALDDSVRASLKNSGEIKVVRYAPPKMFVYVQQLPIDAAGVVGGAAAGSVGRAIANVAAGGVADQHYASLEQLMSQSSFPDPILKVEGRFVHSVQPIVKPTKLVMPNVLLSLDGTLKEDDINMLANLFQQDVVFDFKTIRWGIYPVLFEAYKSVEYQGRARLMRFPDKTILWQGVCDVVDKDTVGMPSLYDLYEDDGALLRGKLDKLADSCADQLSVQFSADGK